MWKSMWWMSMMDVRGWKVKVWLRCDMGISVGENKRLDWMVCGCWGWIDWMVEGNNRYLM
ncbi:hypothetical protein [Candidatus Hodgkinia cicadicola]|uniref:hypothetical protein n=1 Tax=Candidatus Hodgkinia cicadicola TaxID=573658 RepID=UPI0011BA637D